MYITYFNVAYSIDLFVYIYFFLISMKGERLAKLSMDMNVKKCVGLQ